MAAFASSTFTADACGPLIASFPAPPPSSSTQFNCFRNAAPQGTSITSFISQKSMLSGQTSSVDFLSMNRDLAASSSGSFSDYLVAVHDRRTGKVTIRQAPLYIMSREVKRLKQLRSVEGGVAKRLQARSILGQTFGSKRSRAAIQAAERNRVDVSAMNQIAHHLQEDIVLNTSALPDRGETDFVDDGSRPGPPPNLDAGHPDQVYSISAVVPDSELRACPKELFAASAEQDRARIFPYRRSTWINRHLDFVRNERKPDKRLLRLLYHISCMLCFRQATMGKANIEKAASKMSQVPPVVQEGLWARFSEPSRQPAANRVTYEMEVKLLAHMFVLCLVIDDFAADVGALARDLQLPVDRVVKIFRAIGCKIETPNMGDRNRLGLPKDAPLDRRAFLRLPLNFPQPRRGRNQRA